MHKPSSHWYRLEALLRTAQRLESSGAWPFVSRHVLQRADGEQVVLHSRVERKGLPSHTRLQLWRCLWLPQQLNWWIGGFFALGSLLFMLGSALVLLPDWAAAASLQNQQINRIFFAGSIPFSIAAYLQLFQAANAAHFLPSLNDPKPPNQPPVRIIYLGWRPREMGWLACALQFAGTLLFNLNTWDGLASVQGWLRQDVVIWLPDFAGSILFLASAYLAWMETCHAYWVWQPSSLSWWITLINVLGCIAFMISAIVAVVLPQAMGSDMAMFATAFTFLGGGCFLLGSLLMWPECVLSASQAKAPSTTL